MKIRKLSTPFLLISLIAILSFTLAACVAVPAVRPVNSFAAGLVALPDEGRILVVSLITAAVTWVLLQLATVLKIDLSGYVAPIVAIIAPILITLIKSWLGMIPPAFDNIVLTLIHLVVLLVASIGIYVTTVKVKSSQTKNILR